MDETKSERFQRLAVRRGDRIIEELRLLGNLSNRKNYSYSPSEVESLFQPIEDELARVKGMFDGGGHGAIRFGGE